MKTLTKISLILLTLSTFSFSVPVLRCEPVPDYDRNIPPVITHDDRAAEIADLEEDDDQAVENAQQQQQQPVQKNGPVAQ